MKTADEIRKEIIDNTVDDLPIRELRGEMTKQEWAGWFEEMYDKAYKEGLNASQFKTPRIPTIEESGVIALSVIENVKPKLSEKEQALVIAGFQECIKYLSHFKTVEPENRAELLKEIMDTDQEHGMYEPEKKSNEVPKTMKTCWAHSSVTNLERCNCKAYSECPFHE